MANERSSTSRRGRPPKGGTHLSREAIVTAALQVIADEGVGNVSMRTVARILGVDAKSLYNHVDGKDGLLDAIAELLLGSIALPARTGDVRVDLTAIAYAFRDRALVHPEAASLVLTRQLTSLAGLAPVEAALGVVLDAGCPADEAVHLVRAVVAMLVGSLLREVRAAPTFGTRDAAGIARRQAALEQSRFPAVVAAAAHLARFDAAAEFAYSVELAVSAVIARLRERAR